MSEREAWEVLDGLMLGDGGLTKHHKGVHYSMCQSKHTVSTGDHLKWEYWLRDNVFVALGIKATVKLGQKTYSMGAKKGQKYLAAQLWTECTPLLVGLYSEWYWGGSWAAAKGYEHYLSAQYVRNAVKVVPPRIMEAPKLPTCSLAHWFLGDGGSHRDARGDRPNTVTTKLSTCGFSEQEVYRLIDMLGNMGIETGKPSHMETKRGSGLVICLTQSSNDYFMALVEPHIMEIFGDSTSPSYKDLIKYRRRLLAPTLPGLRSKYG